MLNRIICFSLLLILLSSCKSTDEAAATPKDINYLAEKYVRLALSIGQYDEAFVDAYYGPDSLKSKEPALNIFPGDSLLKEVYYLIASLNDIHTGEQNDTIKNRAGWLMDQLVAFAQRIKAFTEDYDSFDKESKELFGTSAPVYEEKYFQDLIAEMNELLP